MANDSARRMYSFDATMVLKDAGLVAASAAATVGGSAANAILDLGASFMAGVVVIDASAIEIGSNDELYTIRLEGSNSSTFASGIVSLGSIRVGSAGGLGTNYADCLPGRYELPFFNVQNDTTYRYIRDFTVVAGTIATGINYTAFLGKMPGAAC